MTNRTISLVFAAVLGIAASDARTEVKLQVEGGWIRLAPPGSMMWAGYATLRNVGDEAVVLSGAGSDRFDSIEIHRSVEENGVSRMRPAGVLRLDPGKELVFEPNGLHFMLMQPRGELREGQSVVLDLLTEQGEPIPAVLTVKREP